MGRPRGRGRGGRGRSTGRGKPASAASSQRARRSSPLASDAIAGPSTYAQGEQDIASSEGVKLPSPPPSERLATSSNTLLNTPSLPQAPPGTSESLSMSTQQAADPSALSASIRHIAESISSLNEQKPCVDEQLRWLISDLKKRLVSSQEILSAVAAQNDPASTEKVQQAVFETLVSKGRDIISYARQNSASIWESGTDIGLYMLIMDLEERLEKR